MRYTVIENRVKVVGGIINEYFVLLQNGVVEQYGRVGDFDSTKDPTLNLNLNRK